GERATMHRVFELIEDGELTVQELAGEREESWKTQAGNFFARNYIRESHGKFLEYATRFAGIARLPEHEQVPLLLELEQELKSARPSMAAGLVLPAVRITAEAVRRGRAYLRCAIAALAVERYRQANNGRWPDSLAALGPKFLAKVPLDPYDGQPLRYRRLPDG